VAVGWLRVFFFIPALWQGQTQSSNLFFHLPWDGCEAKIQTDVTDEPFYAIDELNVESRNTTPDLFSPSGPVEVCWGKLPCSPVVLPKNPTSG
jgi:hypothetical protein